MIGVDKVQPDCGVADKELALFWFANLDLLPFENGGGTGFVDADGVGHFFNLCIVMVAVRVLR